MLTEVPRAGAFAGILLVGWLAGRLARAVVGRLLARAGFDRAAARGGIKAALQRAHYDASDLVARLAQAAVVLVAAQIAFGIWGPNPVSALITALVAWLPKAFVAIVIVVVAAAVARAVKEIVGAVLAGVSYGRSVAGGVSAVIIGLGTIAALDQVGVATSVTTPVLIAVLATVGGVIVVGVGGGLIAPMRERWTGWLDRAAGDAPAIVEQARAYDIARREATIPFASLNDDRTVVIPPGSLAVPIPKR
jgi:hypothetical protein